MKNRPKRRPPAHRRLALEALEPRTLLSVQLGDPLGHNVFRYHDSDGDVFSFGYYGPGVATVTLTGDAADNAEIETVVIDPQAHPERNLHSIWMKRIKKVGDGRADLGNVSAEGVVFFDLNLRHTRFVGDFEARRIRNAHFKGCDVGTPENPADWQIEGTIERLVNVAHTYKNDEKVRVIEGGNFYANMDLGKTLSHLAAYGGNLGGRIEAKKIGNIHARYHAVTQTDDTVTIAGGDIDLDLISQKSVGGVKSTGGNLTVQVDADTHVGRLSASAVGYKFRQTTPDFKENSILRKGGELTAEVNAPNGRVHRMRAAGGDATVTVLAAEAFGGLTASSAKQKILRQYDDRTESVETALGGNVDLTVDMDAGTMGNVAAQGGNLTADVRIGFDDGADDTVATADDTFNGTGKLGTLKASSKVNRTRIDGQTTDADIVGGNVNVTVGVAGQWKGADATGGDMTVRAHAQDDIKQFKAKQKKTRDAGGSIVSGGSLVGGRAWTQGALKKVQTDVDVELTDLIVGVDPGPNGQFGDDDDVYFPQGRLSLLKADHLRGSGNPADPTLVMAFDFRRIDADVLFAPDLRLIENGTDLTVI